MRNLALLTFLLVFCADSNAQITINVTSNTPCMGWCNSIINYDFSDVNNNPDYTVMMLESNIPGQGLWDQATFTTNSGSGQFWACPGFFYIAVVDANDDTTFSGVIVDSPPPQLYGTAENDTYIDSTLTISAWGGTFPYLYSIDNGVTYTSSNVFTGLTPGNYSVTIQDSYGCLINVNPGMNYPPYSCNVELTTTLTPSTGPTEYDGIISWELTNADPFVSHKIYKLKNSWLDSVEVGPGIVSGQFGGQYKGEYTIWVVDDSSCTDTNEVVLEFTPYMDFDDLNECEPCTGGFAAHFDEYTDNWPYTVELYDVTGTPTLVQVATSYTGAWHFTNLCAADYECLIFNSLGDTMIANGTIIDVNLEGTHLNETMINGTITCFASGSAPPYLFSMNGSSWQSSNLFTGLPGSLNYEVYVRDKYNCRDTSEALPLDPSLTDCILEIETIDSLETCFGYCDGSIHWNIQNANPDSTYVLSVTNNSGFDTTMVLLPGMTSGLLDSLCKGSYDFNVSLNSDCSLNHTSKVEGSYAPLEAGLGYVLSPTIGNTDGEFLITTQGGTGPYEYSYTGGDTWQSESLFTGAAGGYCLIYVRDANGCETSILVYLGFAGMSDFNEDLISIFPNPATNQFQYTSPLPVKLELVNMQGQVIHSTSEASTSAEVDLSQFASGTYVVRLYTEFKSVNRKLVID